MKTREAIRKLRWTLILNPPYSSEIAPSDFHIFGVLTDAICGERFGSDAEVIEDVKKWLQVQNSCIRRDRCSYFLLTQGC